MTKIIFRAAAVMLACASIQFVPALAQEPAIPEVDAPAKTTSRPVLDGKLDDESWKSALKLGPFREHQGRDAQLTAATTALLLWDDENLYIGFDCAEPVPENLVIKEAPRDGNIFSQDCIEVMINPRPNRRDYVYYHLAVSAGNTQFDQRVTPRGVEKSWDGAWQSATWRGPDRWQAELVVPLSTLSIADASYWTVNFLREKAKPGEYSCWSPTFGPFHTLSRFGRIKGLQSSLIGRQSIESVAPIALSYGQSTIKATLTNRDGQPRTVTLDLNVTQPDGSRPVPRFDRVELPPKSDTPVNIPVQITRPGSHTFDLTLRTGTRLLEKQSFTADFSPLRVTPAGRSFWIGQPIRLLLALSVEAEQSQQFHVTATLTQHGAPDRIIRQDTLPITGSSAWVALPTNDLAQGVTDVILELRREEQVLDRQTLTVELTPAF
jgi:hypothetical protein